MSKEIISSCCNPSWPWQQCLLATKTGTVNLPLQWACRTWESPSSTSQQPSHGRFVAGSPEPCIHKRKRGKWTGDALARGDVVHTDTTSKKLWGSSQMANHKLPPHSKLEWVLHSVSITSSCPPPQWGGGELGTTPPDNGDLKGELLSSVDRPACFTCVQNYFRNYLPSQLAHAKTLAVFISC